MSINEVLKDLRFQRDEIERAIAIFEWIGAKRRDRPPKWRKALEEHTAQKKLPKDQGN
jgi:hypothetical protein